jgi:radical SAM superfamily enzyme YgiQ (UPF0313 family)
MKKIVLFFPRPWPGETMSGRIPYSLLMLYSYLKDTDFEVKIVDQRTVPDIASVIDQLDSNTLCFGISSFTGVQIKNGLEIARQLKTIFPQTPIVWGGWHPSSMAEQTLKHPLVDIVVRGQGEVTFKELLLALNEKRNLSEVKGISYKLNGQHFHNEARELSGVIKDFKLPFEAVDIEKYIYKKAYAGRADKTIGIITSLGCPNNCGFCAVGGLYKQHVFFRNIDSVLEEVDYFSEKYKINAITIDDDNFFVSPKRVRKFCTELINKPYSISWDAGISVNLLLKLYTDEDLRLIKESGCEQLYIGAESGSDVVLQMINKKATVLQTYEFVRKMREIGIKASLSSMVGLPNVSSGEIFETMDMILKCREINPDFDFRIFYYTPYPSTPLYNVALKAGMQEPENLGDWSEHTLRKYKAPWVKKSYRKQVKYFTFYYFPYSGNTNHNCFETTPPKKIGEFIYRLFFGNVILQYIAKWRTKHRYFKFPLDAMFVMQGRRLKSLYGRLVHKNIDVFYEFDH